MKVDFRIRVKPLEVDIEHTLVIVAAAIFAVDVHLRLRGRFVLAVGFSLDHGGDGCGVDEGCGFGEGPV